ncbi:unnamed protein product [Moneuplotes crassus]|uniref:Uncharacterized protein n=1 Tax=Euplotes crassus TaxID=5936 RepID=A0AAD1X6L8_EUPCR|nr:unnamed protein product [Moneuplotes crassus]
MSLKKKKQMPKMMQKNHHPTQARNYGYLGVRLVKHDENEHDKKTNQDSQFCLTNEYIKGNLAKDDTNKISQPLQHKLSETRKRKRPKTVFKRAFQPENNESFLEKILFGLSNNKKKTNNCQDSQDTYMRNMEENQVSQMESIKNTADKEEISSCISKRPLTAARQRTQSKALKAERYKKVAAQLYKMNTQKKSMFPLKYYSNEKCYKHTRPITARLNSNNHKMMFS